MRSIFWEDIMNMLKMMQKAQRARSQLKKTQKALEAKTIKSEYGGVRIIANGKQEIVAISLSDEVMTYDKDKMEKILLKALREASKKVQKLLEDESKTLAQGMDMNEMMKMFK
ncbi:MAG: YbaB/EbfC family nucleoid-associated protein [Elusimicrobiota bacterium]